MEQLSLVKETLRLMQATDEAREAARQEEEGARAWAEAQQR